MLATAYRVNSLSFVLSHDCAWALFPPEPSKQTHLAQPSVPNSFSFTFTHHPATHVALMQRVLEGIKAIPKDKLVMIAPNPLPPPPWGPPTSSSCQQTTRPTCLTSHEDNRQSYGSDLLPTNQDTKTSKWEGSIQESQQPKRVKQSHDETYIKLEPDHSVEKYDFDDSDDTTSVDNDEPADVPAATIAHPVPASKAPSPGVFLASLTAPAPVRPGIEHQESSGQLITSKMHDIHILSERVKGCRKEIERIDDDIQKLESRAPGKSGILFSFHTPSDEDLDLVKNGSAKWLIARVATLGEEKQAVRAVLDKTTKKQLARKLKLEKERQKQQEQKRKLEAKRLSNRQQMKYESGKQIPQVDLTEGLKVVVKIDPNAKAETLRAFKKVESRYTVKQEADIREGPRTKVEED